MKKALSVLILALGFQSGALLAGVNNLIELSDDPAAAVGGQTMISATWTDNGTTSTSLQFDIVFNDSVFTFNNCAVQSPYDAGPYVSSCMQPVGMSNVVRFVTFRIPTNPIESGTPIIVTFDVNGPPGMYQMTVTGVVTNDGDTTDTDPANITVLGASYNSTPFPPGDPIAFGSHIAGDTNPVESLTIDNDGEAGTTLTGTCSVGGANPAAFPISGDVNFSVPEAGPNDVVDIECDSETLSPGTYNASLSCTHDGDSNPASPVTYALSCTINAAPSPEYGSSPFNPGDKIDFGTHTTGDPQQDIVLTIENVGNDDGLMGSCSITSNPNSAYSVDMTAYNLDEVGKGSQTMRTVSCDTSVVGDHDGGVLSCTHNGTAIPSPANYDLNCEVTPTPTYGSTPAPGNPLAMLNANEGNADPTTDLAIDNVGEAGSILTGSCGLSGDPEISISGSAAFSDEVGGPSDTITVACDASAEGTFSSTLSCQADPNTSNPGPHTYDVNCTIGPPDPGTWGSTPPPGGTVDLTPGGPVPEGTDLTNAGQLLVRNDGDPGDEDIEYTCDIVAGSPEITQSPSPAMGTLVAGGPDDVINYSCDTTADGAFSADVECVWTAPVVVEGLENLEMYTVTCEVRDAESDVEESPPSGTPQTAEVGPGESHTFSFLFNEVLDEGEDATLEDCQLASGGDFAITSPASFPQTIPSGGSVQVDVQFTEPGTGDTFNDTLTCQWTDTDSDPGEATWPLEVTVTGRNATFHVTKDFNDDNPAGVEVMLECNTGLPLQQQAVIHDPDAAGLEPGDFTHVDFVVVDFEPGTMDCDISEVVPAGYAPSYFADFGQNGIAGDVFDDEDGCHYEDVESADFICEITNTLQPVDVVVEKDWIDEHPEFQLPTTVEVTLRCEDPIIGGFNCIGGRGNGDSCSERFIDPNNPGVFQVLPHFDGTECVATEELIDGVLTDQSDCESMIVFPGQGESCVIVNTRLFAGIPTLSQYGLLLMALLMLGVGLVGFRRYA